jgi:thiamine kinase-like enzyme
MDNLSQILKRFPQFIKSTAIEIKELSGGITNKNYKIDADGECYVLRLGGNETHFLGIDRKYEYECSALAWEAGIAPEPVAFLEPEGFILARFVSGKGLSLEEIGAEANIQRVVQSMKSYHGLDYFPGSFSPFRIAEVYAYTARDFKVTLPAKVDMYLAKSREIEQTMYRDPWQPRPCHNDLLNGNFIDDGTRIRILEWFQRCTG